MDIIWTIICYLVLIGSIFSKRMTVLKEKSLWIYRLLGLAIIIFVTWIANIEGPLYLFCIGIGISFIKVKMLNIENATEEQIKDSLDYEENENNKDNDDKRTDNTSISISNTIKKKIQFVRDHYKLLIVSICAIAIVIVGSEIYYYYENSYNNDDQNSSEVIESKKEKVYTVDEICSDPSKYEGMKITVKGTILNGTVPVNDDIGDLKPPLYGSNDRYIILDGDWPEQENVNNVLVEGKITIQGKDIIIKVEKYNFDNVTEVQTTQNDLSNTIFGKMRDASSSYAYLNWNQFFNNPTSLAGTFIYIPGQVVDINYSNGMTYGLIDTLGKGDIKDMVSFTISGEVYDISIGQTIAPMGFISSQTGLATNSATNQTVSTPLIEVSDPSLWKTDYYLDLTDEEIKNFMYGTYTAVDESDIDDNLGEEFVFTADSIGGHQYTYKDTVYNNPSISVTSGSLMRGYDDMRIGMNLLTNDIGYSIGDSELEVTTVSIDLKDGTMSVNSDGGHTSRYRKIN